MALFGSGVAELTRHRAEQLARDLVERSKQNRDELLKLIRGEIQNQIQALGVATTRDLERLERRVTRLEGQIKDLKERQVMPKKPASKRKTTAAKKRAAKASTSSTRSEE
jgi:cell division protein FtsB